MELQEKLRCLRKESGISQIDLAEKLEVSRQTISRWEAGASIPTTENLMRLSTLYGVPLDEWTGENWPSSQQPGPELDMEVQAAPELSPEDAAVKENRKTKSRWRKWYISLIAFLLGIGFAVGVMFFFRQRSRPTPISELESEVIDFSTLGEPIHGLPPLE